MDGKREKDEKLKQAIALEYDPSDAAPRVIASGRGILAEKIIEKAKENDVPVHQDDKLADTLSRLDRSVSAFLLNRSSDLCAHPPGRQAGRHPVTSGHRGHDTAGAL